MSITAATITRFSAQDTLIAANGADTLEDDGSSGNTLVGNLAGSTLIGNSNDTVAAYTADGVTVDLVYETASAVGAPGDTLEDIRNAAALGTNDVLIGSYYGTSTLSALAGGNTLIGGNGTTTLVGLVNGSTLIAGSGTTIASYADQNGNDNVVVNLATQTVTTSGSNLSDTLVGIHAAEISTNFFGTSDTLIGDSGNDTLIAAGYYGTLIGGSGDDTLIVEGDFNTLIGGSGNELLTSTAAGGRSTLIAGTGSDTLASAGAGNVLVGGSGQDLLTSTGFSRLIAGTSADTLISTGFDDVLVGNALGSTLIAEAGKLAVAVYDMDNVTVDLTAGTATVNGSSTSDTLTNIAIVQTSGNDDTLVGGTGTTTLTASGTGDTLIAGSGPRGGHLGGPRQVDAGLGRRPPAAEPALAALAPLAACACCPSSADTTGRVARPGMSEPAMGGAAPSLRIGTECGFPVIIGIVCGWPVIAPPSAWVTRPPAAPQPVPRSRPPSRRGPRPRCRSRCPRLRWFQRRPPRA